jgi:hypothetical protein
MWTIAAGAVHAFDAQMALPSRSPDGFPLYFRLSSRRHRVCATCDSLHNSHYRWFAACAEVHTVADI